MSELSTLARPYAEAVFQIARDGGLLDAWLATLERLAFTAADPSVRALAGDPRVLDAQLVDLLFGAVGDSAPVGLHSMLSLVVENHRLDALPGIATQFRSLKNAHEGVADATVETAFELDHEALSSLQASLERRLGLRLNVQVTVDPSLIGGVRVTVGDKVLDASVRRRLDGMRSALLNPN
jgi:F-type H+-transporting ATPase subunit delta